MKNNNFLYFFIDVYNSRKIFQDRQDITYSILKNLAKYLNKRFNTDLSSPFQIREGDGILGGTSKLALLVDIYEACLEFKYTKFFTEIDLHYVKENDVKFYFGSGIGNITTTSDTFESIHTINGTAVSNAKKASDIAKEIIIYNLLPKRAISAALKDTINKQGDYYYRWQYIQPYVVSDSNLDKLINPILYLSYEKYVNSRKQNELYQMKKRYPNLDLYRLGEKLGYKLEDTVDSRQKVSTQISNLLIKSNFQAQQHLLRDLKIYLNGITSSGEI